MIRGDVGKAPRAINLLKTVAPLVGAGVASLPFALDRRRGTTVAPTLSSPTIKNGWLVPNAYLRYRLYDQQGKLVDTRLKTIDKHAKDAWQRLSLHHEAAQDGYVSVELGNSSRRPVWMDGVQIKHQHAAETPTNENARTFIDRGTIAQDTIHLLPFDTTAIANSTGPTNFPGGNDPDDNTSGIGIVSGNGSQSNPYIMSEAVVTAPPIEPDHINTSRVNDNLYHHRGSSGYPSGYYSSSGSGEANPAPSSGNNPDAHPSDVDGKGASHPGQKNWGKLNNNEKIAHIIKAIAYAKQVGIALNLNQYFKNLPRVGNFGFGKQYRIVGSVIINGKTIPITVEIPVIPSERVFDAKPKHAREFHDPNAQYGPYTYIYYYGLGSRYKNTAKVYFSEKYYDDLKDIIGY